MGYRLSSHVSACLVDGGLVFLDYGADRYVRLPPKVEAALLARLATDPPPAADEPLLDPAVRAGLLDVVEGAHDAVDLPSIAIPASSLVERDDAYPAIRAGDIFAAGRSIATAAARLRLNGFAGMVRRIAARNSTRPADRSVPEPITRQHERASRYLAARRLLPAEPRCLLDSLAMLEFLGREAHGAQLVIGVRLAPFSAHCWLQTQSLILNDTTDGTRRFTPILAVG